MNCLYCGEKLGLFSKSREFCNGKHQELFRKRESELAFQRLMQPFGAGESPAPKARTAIPAPTPDATPANALIPTKVEKAARPDKRELVEDRPDKRVKTKDPTKDPVALPSNATADGTTPPLAGFISLSELKPVMRLTVFTRRPEPGSYSGVGPRDLDHRFIDRMLGRRAADERGAESGFPAILCIPPIHPCEPGIEAGTPFVELLYRKPYRTLPIESRQAGFQACELDGAAQQMPAFVPHSKDSEPSVYCVPGAVCGRQPIVMCRRDVPHTPADAIYPGVAPAS